MGKPLKLISRVVLLLAAFIGGLALSGNAFAETSNSSETSPEYLDGQLVVSIEVDSEKQSLQSANESMLASSELEDNGFDVTDSLLDSIQSESTQTMDNEFKTHVADQMGMVYLVEYDQAKYENVNLAKEDLEKSLNDQGLDVRYIEENSTMKALESETADVSPESVHPEQEWNYDMIKAPDAWETTPGSSSTKAAVLDTGIDDTHESLSDYVDTSEGKSFAGGGTDDVQGHGTHVAGTIASYGEVSGVMEEATLVPVKVLGDDGSGSMYDIMEGITYAASIDADVINMSLGGGGYDQGMDEAIDTANDEGTVVVAASGNDGAGSVSYPAAYDGAIAVGSVDSNESRSDFSNYGAELDVMAPGANIYSTTPGDAYEKLSGTSMATPHVAGVVGLIRSADPDISVDDARAVLTETAEDAGSENEYGYGIVNADAAVQEASDGDGGGDDGEDPGNPDPDPEAPAWEAYTSYAFGDVVSYNGQEYVSVYTHFSLPGLEPSNTPSYWSEQ